MEDRMLSVIKCALRVLAQLGQAVDLAAFSRTGERVATCHEIGTADRIVNRSADLLITHCATLSARAVLDITNNACAMVEAHMYLSETEMEGYKEALNGLLDLCLSIPAQYDSAAHNELCAFYGEAIRRLQPDYVEPNDNDQYEQYN